MWASAPAPYCKRSFMLWQPNLYGPDSVSRSSAGMYRRRDVHCEHACMCAVDEALSRTLTVPGDFSCCEVRNCAGAQAVSGSTTAQGAECPIAASRCMPASVAAASVAHASAAPAAPRSSTAPTSAAEPTCPSSMMLGSACACASRCWPPRWAYPPPPGCMQTTDRHARRSVAAVHEVRSMHDPSTLLSAMHA